MKINLRWLIQAVAFVGCIFFFLKIWDQSKTMILHYSNTGLLFLSAYVLCFLFFFFIMALTSYLKQKFNGTLKNQIPFFEKLLSKIDLA